MKAISVSDIHVHNYKQHDRNGSRLANCLRVIDETFKLCLSEKTDTVLFEGDLYDQQKALPTIVVNETIKRFNEWFSGEGKHIVWYAITGNHDQGSKSLAGNEAVSALVHLAEVFPQNFVLLDNDSVVIGEATALCGIPYYEFPEHYREMLVKQHDLVKQAKATGEVSKAILMIHQTPSGLANKNIPVDTDVADELYDVFDVVLCGHIHERQRLAPNFWLNGSPLHRDLGDEGQDKGVFVIDVDNPSGDNMKYVSWADKFPHFKSYKEIEAPTAQEADPEQEYAVIKPSAIALTEDDKVVAEKFSADLKSTELVRNYWETVDGQDNEKLQIGLSFI